MSIAAKWVLDEAVRAGLLPDDTAEHVAGVEYDVVRVPTRAEERVVMTLTRAS